MKKTLWVMWQRICEPITGCYVTAIFCHNHVICFFFVCASVYVQPVLVWTAAIAASGHRFEARYDDQLVSLFKHLRKRLYNVDILISVDYNNFFSERYTRRTCYRKQIACRLRNNMSTTSIITHDLEIWVRGQRECVVSSHQHKKAI